MVMQPLAGATVLVIEDEFVIAEGLRLALEGVGARVLGPVGNIDAALDLLDVHVPDAAILDANLGGDFSLPVADCLQALRVPVLLTTGYDRFALPPSMAVLPRCEKPARPYDVLVTLGRLLAEPRRRGP